MQNEYVHNEPEFILFPDKPVVYAGFGQRFVAVFIDALILAIINFVLESLSFLLPDVFNHSGSMTGGNASANIVILAGYLPGLILNWLYFALQESGRGQATLGKKVVGIKVTTVDNARISFGKATGRFFGRYLSAFLFLIGYLMMLWDERKQTLHDKIAGTVVVKSITDSFE